MPPPPPSPDLVRLNERGQENHPLVPHGQLVEFEKQTHGRKFKTPGKFPILLEESVEYTQNNTKEKPNDVNM